MNDVEKYAVNLVGEGAEGIAEDDMDEDHVFADRNDSRAAATLAVEMAQAIQNNPQAFLMWYRSTTSEVTA